MSVLSVIAVMEDWFRALEKGEQRYPDHTDKTVTIEHANKIVEYIDRFIEGEVREHEDYWRGQGMETRGKAIDKPADFKRMNPLMRLAFAQALLKERGKESLFPTYPRYIDYVE